jgi:hypothetical protein
MSEFDVLNNKCKQFFKVYSEFQELVTLLSKFEPSVNSMTADNLVNYLKLLNFLWTEYRYLYNGIADSAYQLQKKSEDSQSLYFDGKKKTKSRMTHLKNIERDVIKKNQYKNIIYANAVRFDEISVDIESCQKILKDSAIEINAMVKKRSSQKSPQFIVSMKTDPNIPYTLEILINSARTVFDIKSPGSDPKTAHDNILSHAWFPQPRVRPPSKKKKSQVDNH